MDWSTPSGVIAAFTNNLEFRPLLWTVGYKYPVVLLLISVRNVKASIFQSDQQKCVFLSFSSPLQWQRPKQPTIPGLCGLRFTSPLPLSS
jgi:hypothetical protein